MIEIVINNLKGLMAVIHVVSLSFLFFVSIAIAVYRKTILLS